MEMWLRQAEDRFRFPVIPSSISMSGKATINSSNIIKVGEIATFGGIALRSISISSFFPNKEYSFCDYRGFPAPYDCVNKIQKWMNEGLILRFTVTETNINMEVIIEGFSYEEKDGTRDVYFSLDLREYKRLQIPRATPKK